MRGNAAKCGEKLQNGKGRKMQRNASECRNMQRNAEKCKEKERNAAKFREMQRNEEECDLMR